MYCRFCGKQIEDDSLFCTYCGKNTSDIHRECIAEKELTREEKGVPKDTEEPSNSKAFLWVWFAAVFVLVMLVFIAATSSSDDSGSITSRDLKSSDYTYETSQDLTSYRITITPKTDIDNCDIQLSLYNSKGEQLFSDTISKTNLKKGASYTYTFNFGFVNSLSGNKIKYTITGKC